MTPAGAMVEARGLVRDYVTAGATVHALQGVDLHVDRGELLAVRGRSGSGKTTLLNLLGGLDRPTAGTVTVDGIDVSALDEAGAADVRRRTIAFVFQTFGLIPILTAAENVEVPLRLVRADPRARDERVAECWTWFGLAERARHRTHELSGGEQHGSRSRGRSPTGQAALADEPTGQWTPRRAAIMLLLRSVVRAGA